MSLDGVHVILEISKSRSRAPDLAPDFPPDLSWMHQAIGDEDSSQCEAACVGVSREAFNETIISISS